MNRESQRKDKIKVGQLERKADLLIHIILSCTRFMLIEEERHSFIIQSHSLLSLADPISIYYATCMVASHETPFGIWSGIQF